MSSQVNCAATINNSSTASVNIIANGSASSTINSSSNTSFHILGQAYLNSIISGTSEMSVGESTAQTSSIMSGIAELHANIFGYADINSESNNHSDIDARVHNYLQDKLPKVIIKISETNTKAISLIDIPRTVLISNIISSPPPIPVSLPPLITRISSSNHSSISFKPIETQSLSKRTYLRATISGTSEMVGFAGAH